MGGIRRLALKGGSDGVGRVSVSDSGVYIIYFICIRDIYDSSLSKYVIENRFT